MKTERVVFQRGEGLGVKGRWWVVREKKGGPVTTAAITCPDCGKRGMLDEHSITSWGMVSPSVVCECGFHEMIELKFWTHNIGLK
jgi:hypothetical protein